MLSSKSSLSLSLSIYMFVCSPITLAKLELGIACFYRILVYITSAAASYNMLQLCKHTVSACSGGHFKGSYIYMAWISFLLDQVNFTLYLDFCDVYVHLNIFLGIAGI